MINNVFCCSVPVLLALGLLGCLSGCATTQANDNNNDPLEGANRFVYKVNDGLDKYLLVPVAKTYAKYTPEPVREGVSNFFDNLLYLNTILNDFLQGKVNQGLADTGRFLINSSFGIGGLLDPATAWGIPKHNEDFGQTLGVWGMGEGVYLVLPLRGPNSLRDAPDLAVSTWLNPLFYISSPVTFPLGALGVINERANLLEATRIRDEAALDPYIFTREAYRQRRLNDIYDGVPPIEELEEPTEQEEDEGQLIIE